MFSEEVKFLKTLILGLEIVKDNQKIKSGEWNKSSYELLSNLMFTKLDHILSDKDKLSLGITLSPRTLYNLFESKRKIRRPFDKRVIRTLDKLAKFVDLESWDEVVKVKNDNVVISQGKDSTKNKLYNFIQKVKDQEFELYRTLDKAILKALKTNYVSRSTAVKEIAHNFKIFQSTGLTLTNPYNPSSFEVIDLKLRKNKNHQGAYILNTEEYWTLCWYDPEVNKYIKRDKRISKHVYTIIVEESEYKIHTEASIEDKL